MSRKYFWLGSLILLFFALPSIALAQGPPEMHQNIDEYTGPETCAMCHPDAGKEVAESLHYQNQALPEFLDGVDPDVPVGMMTSF
jgi:hypothetical protein